jgi:hypothetical protein
MDQFPEWIILSNYLTNTYKLVSIFTFRAVFLRNALMARADATRPGGVGEQAARTPLKSAPHQSHFAREWLSRKTLY